ncbi:MAG: esterase-like activity of phytase family protein [Chitinophagaceae bacterium]|nr:MAG: esterase-like activity of phytase family protein [Chitinophagaceae bacterium]
MLKIAAVRKQHFILTQFYNGESMMRNLLSFFVLLFFVFACSPQRSVLGKPVNGLRLIGDYVLPHKLQFNGTTVGGLSSIEYVPSEDLYYLICDDRSDINPARFYTAKIHIGNNGIDSIRLLETVTLLQKNGQPFPSRKVDSLRNPDPEALRYNAANKTIVWSSEGERISVPGREMLVDPFIAVATKEGRLIDTFPLPPNMHITGSEKGPRQNGAFEGLAFSQNFTTLYVSMEEPLYEDGPRAGLDDSARWVRIIQYDVETKKPVAQFAYPIDPVVQEPISSGTFILNGVSDILAVNDHQLLVTERSFSTGRLTCNIRVYLAELEGAENIAGINSLVQSPPAKPIRKKLLLNMDTLKRWVDNVEGATFGPILPNGKRSLLFVTDDNFAAFEKTQFFLFEVQ